MYICIAIVEKIEIKTIVKSQDLRNNSEFYFIGCGCFLDYNFTQTQ